MTEEQKLMDWQKKIEDLKTKTTELKTKVNMLEKQLKEEGVKNIAKTMDFINEMEKNAKAIADKISTRIEEIEDEFNLEDE